VVAGKIKTQKFSLSVFNEYLLCNVFSVSSVWTVSVQDTPEDRNCIH